MSVLSKERLTEKTKDCFGYKLKDGSDSEVGFFKDYDAFYSHMMTVKALGEYEDLEEQGLLLRLPCKVGADVFTIERSEVGTFYVRQSKVVMFEFFGAGLEVRLKFTNKIETYTINRIFLTQSEAEEKLTELEGK